MEYNPNTNSHSDTGVPSRRTLNIVSDGVSLYWLYYHDVTNQTGSGRHMPANQSGSTSGSSSTFGVVEVYLEVLELMVSTFSQCFFL